MAVLNFILSNEGKQEILEAITGVSGGTLYLKMFKNNVTPSATSVLGDFVEDDSAEYEDAALTFDKWTFTTSPTVSASYPEVTLPSSGSAVYGAYIVDTIGGGALIGAGKFAEVQNFQVEGSAAIFNNIKFTIS